jgi:hypothetical protein
MSCDVDAPTWIREENRAPEEMGGKRSAPGGPPHESEIGAVSR